MADNNQDIPREIQSGEVEKEELRKRMIYGAESDRVLHLAPSQLRFYLIKLLSLINAFCYPILALLTIRLQLLYYRYSWHQDEDKISGTFYVYLMHWDYSDEKIILLAIFGGTLIISLVL